MTTKALCGDLWHKQAAKAGAKLKHFAGCTAALRQGAQQVRMTQKFEI
ncbi:MAG: hypothetical protein LH479_10125 [Polaromonas sp.]|nr:hypothetical protein [Polaromonas sp.]